MPFVDIKLDNRGQAIGRSALHTVTFISRPTEHLPKKAVLSGPGRSIDGTRPMLVCPHEF
jgi:hypothetical protein